MNHDRPLPGASPSFPLPSPDLVSTPDSRNARGSSRSGDPGHGPGLGTGIFLPNPQSSFSDPDPDRNNDEPPFLEQADVSQATGPGTRT